jgi:hypothetical protein
MTISIKISDSKPVIIISMKNIILKALFVSAGFILLTFFSCEEDLETPEACLEAPDTAYVGDPVIFRACSPAEYISIWPGDSLHKYDGRMDTTLYNEENQRIRNLGETIDNSGEISYIYETVGRFTVTLVAGNAGGELGDQYKQDVTQTTIYVTDDQDVFSSFALGIQIRTAFISLYPGRIEGDTVIIPIPDDADVSNIAARFDAGYAEVYVDGVKQLSRENTHDFTEPVSYTIHPYDGSEPNEVTVITVIENSTSN